MPIIRKLDNGLLRTTLEGFVTMDDIRMHVREERLTGTFKHPEIVDARAGVAEISFSDLVKVATLVKDTLGWQVPARRAVIVGSHEQKRFAQAFALLAAPWMPVRVFDDAGEAERWVRPEVPLEPAATHEQDNPESTTRPPDA